MKNAVILISHGSHSAQVNDEVLFLSRKLKKRLRVPIFEHAFLEINTPTIPTAIERCAKKGATDIFVLFNFFSSGSHVLRDIPAIIRKAKRRFPKVRFHFTGPIGQHQKIINLFADLYTNAKHPRPL